MSGNLQYHEAHYAWQQRVNKEKGCAERYEEKGYDGGFDHKNGPWVAVHPEASDTSSYAPKY